MDLIILIKVKNNAIWQFNNGYTPNITEDSFNLNLADGWNSVSLPLSSDSDAEDIFGQSKLFYIEGNRWSSIQGNSQLNYSYSYWLKSNQSSISISGTQIASLTFSIKKGINTLNYPLPQETSTALFFNSVIGNIDSISAFENGQWKTYAPSKPDELNTLTTLKPGIGIFVKAKNDAYWIFDGSVLVPI